MLRWIPLNTCYALTVMRQWGWEQRSCMEGLSEEISSLYPSSYDQIPKAPGRTLLSQDSPLGPEPTI